MSRKATDLSGVQLTRGERLKKTCGTDIPRWIYNKEDGSYLGERTPLKWGKLLLFYFLFYSGVTIFFIICYSVMMASVPRLPDNMYFCSTDPNSQDPLRCRDGPRFKAFRINDLEGNPRTAETMTVGLIEPTLSAFPANIYVSSENPITIGNVEGVSKSAYYEVNAAQPYNWGLIVEESRRASCDVEDANVQTAITVDQCDNTLINRIFPTQIPKLSTGNYTKSPFEGNDFQGTDFFLNLESSLYGPSQTLSNDLSFRAPLPYAENIVMKDVEDVGDDRTVNTYLMMFRLNKMWNYEPMDRERKGTKVSDFAQVVNDIGVKCYFTGKACKNGDKGVNYKGEPVECTEYDNVRDVFDNNGNWDLEAGTLSRDGALKIDMITPVMSKATGFPWIGGAYDQSFAAAMITWDTAKPLGTKGQVNNLNAPKIACEWGRQVQGETWNGTTITTVPIANKQKDGYGGTRNANKPRAEIIAFQIK